MAQVILELDSVEQQVLKKLLELGLFETPQEAFRIALLKYAVDLWGLKDIPDDIQIKVPNLGNDTPENKEEGEGEE